MMTAQDVLQIVDALRRAGIGVWIDGGWGVDALVEEETRDHDDLDCVIALGDAPAARAALAPLGFVVIDDELPTRFVVRDAADRRADFHPVTSGEDGGGVQELHAGTSWRCPPGSFLATGRIAGQPVPCLTDDVQLPAHVDYETDGKDFHDMRVLARRFRLDLPAPYQGRS